MRDNFGRIIPIGDPPSIYRRVFWELMGRCKKCGGVLEKVKVYYKHRKKLCTRTARICTRCGSRYSSKSNRTSSTGIK